MAPSAAVGLWKTTFGPVKIELDDKRGPGQVRGIWFYKRGGEQVVGDFGGQLRGNVLQFTWREPAKPNNLTGSGYLVFDQRGQRFHGKWWTNAKDRTGTWTGWRHGQQNRQPDNRQPYPPRQPDNRQPYPNDGYDRRPPPPTSPPNDPYGNGGGNRPPPPTQPPAGNAPYPSGTSLPPM